ncbi:MAG: hypothetical protein SH868_01885, partial [Bythopirellula sp.]|nr:hypothetical protein [Bythopirellula sp.]
MTFLQQKKWQLTLLVVAFSGVWQNAIAAEGEPADETPAVDVFDAIDQGIVDVKFIARDSQRGRLFLTNKTEKPVDVIIPDAFAGVPVLHQFGGGGGGMG